ncbi:hypothetical protein NVP1238A_27 [Vibrio phage 1.238.A._10N.261.52.F10]|uniref:Uncharacterized protein n=2 Tax=Pariacacavirus TaxID=2948856 RepID=A0A2I7RUD1_9CAUD|nr:hypothetical protein KNT79_gp27 [Vibrio phage 1.238.A._10N.261.52.F10]YP_010093474.1 hypothetical protein KNT80_gp31 [Vibrio phage 1.245.O._10N.261.54.C7]AUR97276.1 hypothetical protein NVP1238A_27 [Vibrio phage 1.238.A._10N.261.52.F10]AUR97370.1 hypothetical protein NVP1238B_28 [Vibrio phage 1.238.B._10N.261.52.F10]AUR97944.1 hypothetical protein NVP1245O_31 [Vibrio phage 1.245.O._10N.261.54.C7]
MQRLTPEIVNSAESAEGHTLPALEGAVYYFALVHHQGKKILCHLNEDKVWVPVTYDQMVQMM